MIYCRISDDRIGDGAGVERQEKDCRELCARLGWQVVAVFVDNSKSAWLRDRRRPGWDALLDGLRRKEYDAVVVYHGDRLMRQPRDLEDLLDIADQGVQLASPTGRRDLSNPDDRFILRIEVAHACRSSDDTSRRTRRKHAELAEAGAAVGGGRPFGYEDDKVTIRGDEADLVREAAQRILAGDTLRSICSDWRRREVLTARGNDWNQTGLRRLLTEHRVAGHRSLGRGGPVVARSAWPAILDDDTHMRVRAVLLAPERRVSFGARSHLLTGFLACGRCGTKLIARRGRERRRTYICTSDPGKGGCGGLRVIADPLEELITEAVFLRLDSPALSASIAEDASPRDELLHDLGQLESRLTELADMWAAGAISRSEWLTARSGIEARLESGRREYARERNGAALEEFVGRPGALRAAWDGLSLDRRRAVLRSVIDRIDIGPARRGVNRFDPDRVDVRWLA